MKYLIQTIETDGPSEELLELPETIAKLNNDIQNEKIVFIDGVPVMNKIITEEILVNYKDHITITNKLIGG